MWVGNRGNVAQAVDEIDPETKEHIGESIAGSQQGAKGLGIITVENAPVVHAEEVTRCEENDGDIQQPKEDLEHQRADWFSHLERGVCPADLDRSHPD